MSPRASRPRTAACCSPSRRLSPSRRAAVEPGGGRGGAGLGLASGQTAGGWGSPRHRRRREAGLASGAGGGGRAAPPPQEASRLRRHGQPRRRAAAVRHRRDGLGRSAGTAAGWLHARAAAGGSPPSSLGAAGWAAPQPPPRGGFKPAPPPSSTPSGGFNARRAVLGEMPAAAAAPQAPDRASPGPGGRGRQHAALVDDKGRRARFTDAVRPRDGAGRRPRGGAAGDSAGAGAARADGTDGGGARPHAELWVAAPAAPPPAPAPPPRRGRARGVRSAAVAQRTRVPDSTTPRSAAGPGAAGGAPRRADAGQRHVQRPEGKRGARRRRAPAEALASRR